MRMDHLNWHQFFFGISYMAAMRSKDPSTQCGACLVRDFKSIGVGYNGLVNGYQDNSDIWQRDEKTKYILHAEENALLNCTVGLKDFHDCHLYIWTSNGRVYLPCERCARMISQARIPFVHIIERSDTIDPNTDDRWNTNLTLDIFEKGGVTLVSHEAKKIHGALWASAQEKLTQC